MQIVQTEAEQKALRRGFPGKKIFFDNLTWEHVGKKKEPRHDRSEGKERNILNYGGEKQLLSLEMTKMYIREI